MPTYLPTVILFLVAGILLALITVFTLRVAVRRRTKQLAESRARFRRLAEATFEGIILYEGAEIVDVNRALTDMLGYEADELRGRGLDDVLSATTQAEREEDAVSEAAGPREVVMVRKDGSTFPAEIEEKVVTPAEQPVHVAAIRNITERKKREAALLDAKEEAEEMSRLKSSLLNNMSHEFRTPITSIIGYAELIQSEPADTHEAFATRIKESGQRLSRTMHLVLEMAQIESGTLELTPREIDVMGLVRDVAEKHRPQAVDDGLFVEITGPESYPLYSDRTLLRRIVDTLVHNAVKFTEEGHVRVAVEPMAHSVQIAVTDTGIGIDPTFLDDLFEPFTQESQGRARTHEGLGLGLALAKRMVERLGGTIEVDSTEGEGSTFIVRLPPLSSSTELDEDESADG